MNNNINNFFKLSSVVLLLFTASYLNAQTSLTFDAKEINLGYIPEDTGNVVVDFFFKNTSKAPIQIVDVGSHGGCTVLSWPQDSLLSGYQGKLSVKLNPKNRPGALERKVTFTSLPDSTVNTLVIKAYVEPTDKIWNKNSNETRYGNLVVSSDYVRVGTVLENAKVEGVVSVRNSGKEVIKLQLAKAKLPSYITITGLPENLGPQAEVKVKLAIDFSTSKKLGKYVEMISIPTNQQGVELVIYVIGEIIPYTPSSSNNPTVEMLIRTVNLDEISSEKPVHGSFVIKNSGLSPLLIRKVETSCLCIDLEQNGPVAPGASSTLNFVFDPRGLKGIEEKKITLYTNVPSEPIINLLVKAKVIP
jgi:hypothetical protein